MKKLGNSGFTLVEMIVTVAILGILSMVALPIISNLQTNYKEYQCDVLKESFRSAAKLYVEQHAEDLFGNQKNACQEITIQELIDEKLLNLPSDMDDCFDPSDMIRITKKDTNYIFENVEDGVTTCDGSVDETGPTITFCPNGSTTPKKAHTTTITISDNFGYSPNVKIKYYWINSSGSKVANSEKTYDFKNKKQDVQDPKLTTTVTSPSGLTGNYRLVVEPVSVVDSLGNVTTVSKTSGEFSLDNTPPTAGINIVSQRGDYNDRVVRVTVSGSDNKQVKEVCYTATNNSSTCTWKSGSSYTGSYTFPGAVGSGSTYTLYAFAKDSADNISSVAAKSYKIYASCSNDNLKDIDCTSGWDEGSRPCTTPHGLGWGKKGRTCAVKDRITKVTCSWTLRTCPCDNWCNREGRSHIPFSNGANWDDDRHYSPHGPCVRPFCANGVLCAGNACWDATYY